MRNVGREPNSLAQNSRGIRKSKMKASVRVALIGARGRMGQTIADLAKDDPKIDIVAQCDLGDAIDPAVKDCDVAIDFSNATAITQTSRPALHHRKPLTIAPPG